jgi:hypothetical protein
MATEERTSPISRGETGFMFLATTPAAPPSCVHFILGKESPLTLWFTAQTEHNASFVDVGAGNTGSCTWTPVGVRVAPSPGVKYPCNGPWRPIGLWDIEAPTVSRKSAHSCWWGCQPYAQAALYPRMIPGTHFCGRLSRPQDHSAAGRIMLYETFIGLIGNRTGDSV